MNEEPIICADIIAEYQGELVTIERLTHPIGICFPGGKQEPGERLSTTAEREFHEETGMYLTITGVLGTFGRARRDSRGNYISTVFIGQATGMPVDEDGKTQVRLLARAALERRKQQLLFDHAEMFEQYCLVQPTE